MEQMLEGIYDGDRTHPMYMKFKNDLFNEGPLCSCGVKVKEDCYLKPCKSKKTLSNHMVFPTFCALDKLKKSEKNSKHWAFMLEVSNFELSKFGHKHVVEGFGNFNEFARISFDKIGRSDAGKKVYSDIGPSYTVVVLYAKPDDNELKMVIPENPEFCCVFKLPIYELQEEAEKILSYYDSLHENKDLRCFGCGVITNELFQCSACKMFKYCSRECQTKSWNYRHVLLCKQSEILLRLACLPRYQNTLSDKYFTFNLNENDNIRISLPPYIFKTEFVLDSVR
jgi:hypothetical protein